MREEGAFNNREKKTGQESVSQREDLSLLRSSAERLIAEAHSNIGDMYRTEEQDPLERREYHNVKHTEGVEDKAEKILNTTRKAEPSIGITERDIILARLIASHHDVDQSQDEPKITPERMGDEEFQKTQRKRYIEQIEKNSAGILVGRMQQVNEQGKKEVFTKQDMEIARAAILATIPGFAKGTVVQPKLNDFAEESLKRQLELKEEGKMKLLEEEKKKYILVLTIALADLGAMMDGAEEFLRDGNGVFREDNIDIADAMEVTLKMSDQQKEYIYGRIKGWYGAQVKFVEGRREIFELQILSFPDAAKEDVKKLFKFDEAIQAARERLQKVNGDEAIMEKEADPEKKKKMKDLLFEVTVKEMGYRI